MQFCIFEDDKVDHLKPLVTTRAVFDLRVGHQTLLERLCRAFDIDQPMLRVRPDVAEVTARAHPHALVNEPADPDEAVLFVNGRCLALDETTVARMKAMASDGGGTTVFMDNDTVVAAWVPESAGVDVQHERIDETTFDGFRRQQAGEARFVSRLWHFIEFLPELLVREGRCCLERHGARSDTERLQDEHVIIGAPERVCCADNAVLKPGAVLNAEYGPIIVDERAVVMEGAVLRGPVYVGPHCQVRPGARVEASALGPHSRIGGEVERSIIHSYTTKMHDGFLGNSYIGRWCNLAADANTSTLKNDYGKISLYSYPRDSFEQTGRQHLGLFMGDHSMCGINSMFNPGCVVGVFCNLFGTGYMPRFIPSFSWGSPGQFSPYHLEKALEVAAAKMARRGVELSDAERELLQRIHARVHGAGRVTCRS